MECKEKLRPAESKRVVSQTFPVTERDEISYSLLASVRYKVRALMRAVNKTKTVPIVPKKWELNIYHALTNPSVQQVLERFLKMSLRRPLYFVRAEILATWYIRGYRFGI